MKTTRSILFFACGNLFATAAYASCGAAFCNVNSNWTSESAALEPGSSFDLRYEFIRQDQPRSGTKRVAVGALPRHHDEMRTLNRNLVAGYSYTFDSQWGVSVTAAVVDRDHFHVHNHHGARLPEQWNFTAVGDARIIGRYTLSYIGDPARPGTAGFTFGVKLPTGKTDVSNAAGDVAERSLQPGSATTDAIVGAYYHQKLPEWGASWFASTQVQRALNSKRGFRPGDQFALDIGYRHGLTDRLGALLQVNLSAKGRDRGAQAEPQDSGGRFASLSPGFSVAVSDEVQLYGFFQKPVYQRVNGVQLTADKALVVGVAGRF